MVLIRVMEKFCGKIASETSPPPESSNNNSTGHPPQIVNVGNHSIVV